jgi:hypothetical protein
MKRNLISVLIFIASTLISNGQELISHLEVWGYSGNKQEFVNKYKVKTGVDLNKESYCCMATLFEMGYENPFAIVYSNDPMDRITGRTNYKLADRLVVVREIADNKYTKIAADKIWQTVASNLLSEINQKDNKAKNQFLKENNEKFKEFLIATLAPYKNMGLRIDYNNLLFTVIDFTNINLTPIELEILSTMLSFPDPNTCYSAMKILSENKIKSKEIILREHAETLKDFLKSTLRTFRKDAIKFLSEIEPKGKDWSYQTWIKWIKNNGC